MNWDIDPRKGEQERFNFENMVYYTYNQLVNEDTQDNWLRLETRKALPSFLFQRPTPRGGDHYADPSTAYRDNPQLHLAQSNPVLYNIRKSDKQSRTGFATPYLSWSQARSVPRPIVKPEKTEPMSNAEAGAILYPDLAAVKAKEDRDFSPLSTGQLSRKMKEDRRKEDLSDKFKSSFSSFREWRLSQENPILHDIMARNFLTRSGYDNKDTAGLPGNQTLFKDKEWFESRDKTWAWSERFAKEMMGLDYGHAAVYGTAAATAGALMLVAGGPAAIPAAMSRLAMYGLSEMVGDLISQLGEKGLAQMGMPPDLAHAFTLGVSLYLTARSISRGFVGY